MTHPDSFNPILLQRISNRISETPQQRITFAEFMELALYDPEQGYYATNQVQIGVAGDFFTSPHLCPDFGELLAEQFLDMWRVMGQPEPFTLVEMGAGQGLVAADVLKYLATRKQSAEASDDYAAFWTALRYIIVEKAEGLIEAQQRLLQPFQFSSDKVQWMGFGQLPETGIVGCFFSNELVDALPVHQFVVQDGALQEVFVAVDAASRTFTEVMTSPSTDRLAEYLVSKTSILVQGMKMDIAVRLT